MINDGVVKCQLYGEKFYVIIRSRKKCVCVTVIDSDQIPEIETRPKKKKILTRDDKY